MSILTRALLIGAGLCLLNASSATAQFQNPNAPRFRPFSRPRLSPYLNFLRGGDPASNYYLGVVRQRQQRQTNQAFRGAILDLDQRETQPLPEDLQDYFAPPGSTGHATGFMQYGGYYNRGVGPQIGMTRLQGSPASRRPGRTAGRR